MSTALAVANRTVVFPPGPRDWTPFPFTRGMRDDPLGFVGALLARHGVPKPELTLKPANGVQLRIEARRAA